MSAAAAVQASSSWTRFGGEAANFSVDSSATWPKDGPRELWRRPLGPGYSAIATSGSELFTMARDGADERVLALDADSGRTLWEHRYETTSREGHLVQFGKGPHATPLVLDDRVIVLGYTGVLKALARADGKELWSWHLLDQLGGDVLRWGYSASPILEGGRVIVLVGGDQAGVIAFDPKTGEKAWEGPKTRVSFASPIVIEVGDQRQLLYFSHDALNALNPQTGESLWHHEMKNSYENHASMPVWVPEKNLLWVVSQQEAAGRALRLTRTEAENTETNETGSAETGNAETKIEIEIEEIWTNSRLRVHHWNSLALGDTAFAAVGGDGSILTGVDLSTGKMLWKERGYNKANFVHTAGGTLALDEDGVLSWLELTRLGVTERGRLQVFQGVSWTAPTVVGRRIYLRDKKEIVALELNP